MKTPTLDILDAIYPEYKLYQDLKPDVVRLKEYTTEFSLNNKAWESHYSKVSALEFSWQEFKYSDVVNKKTIIEKVVPNTIGVYLFIVKPLDLIFDLPKYVYYVGIAGAGGSGRTLRARLKDYFAESHLRKRDAIRILIYKHYENVYIGYSTIAPPSGVKLEDIEKSLIGYFGTHILANRDDIPIELQPQVKAFNI